MPSVLRLPEPSLGTLRVWLVDSDEAQRETFSAALSALGDVRIAPVVQSFSRASELRQALAAGFSFDVALVELDLVDLPGERLVAELARSRPAGAVVVLTHRADDASVLGALAAGAAGYLHKETALDELYRAIRLAAVGGAPLSPDIRRRLACHARGIRLTPRQSQVLELLCTGASYRRVAQNLMISVGTVQTHVKSLYGKLGVRSKAEAVRLAFETDLLELRL